MPLDGASFAARHFACNEPNFLLFFVRTFAPDSVEAAAFGEDFNLIADVEPFLGRGLFSVPEAALYARVRPRMMSRWIFGNAGKAPRKAVFSPEIASGEKLVSFLDFVQTLAIRAIRLQRKVPLQKIREALASAQKHWNMQYPFAMRHTTYLVGKEIVIVPPRSSLEETKEYVRVTGKHKDNYLLKPVVELYLQNLDVDQESGFASGYTAFACRNGVSVKMDPCQRFGEPLLPSGYAAPTIWEAVDMEGGIEETARAYGIPREEVEAALWFFDYLSGQAA
jgi:hypothetical protein